MTDWGGVHLYLPFTLSLRTVISGSCTHPVQLHGRDDPRSTIFKLKLSYPYITPCNFREGARVR